MRAWRQIGSGCSSKRIIISDVFPPKLCQIYEGTLSVIIFKRINDRSVGIFCIKYTKVHTFVYFIFHQYKTSYSIRNLKSFNLSSLKPLDVTSILARICAAVYFRKVKNTRILSSFSNQLCGLRNHQPDPYAFTRPAEICLQLLSQGLSPIFASKIKRF